MILSVNVKGQIILHFVNITQNGSFARRFCYQTATVQISGMLISYCFVKLRARLLFFGFPKIIRLSTDVHTFILRIPYSLSTNEHKFIFRIRHSLSTKVHKFIPRIPYSLSTNVQTSILRIPQPQHTQ